HRPQQWPKWAEPSRTARSSGKTMTTIPRLSSEPPADFPPSRWGQLRADHAAFVESPWHGKAERLGWSELDLYGVDATRPYARTDGLGLIPALDRCRIV